MKALILNSGIGKRMGDAAKNKPKCMTQIGGGFTIISWQLHLLSKAGIKEAVITTGPFADKLEEYVDSLNSGMKISYVANPDYDTTNYIYSIYCAREQLSDDILLMHGDLVFEESVLDDVAARTQSSVTVDSSLPLPEKDFKACIQNGRVKRIGIEFFSEGCVACQPLYNIRKADMLLWLGEIDNFCKSGITSVYAENALNNITDEIALYPAELSRRLCSEIDNEQDLRRISPRFKDLIEPERI